MSIIIAHNSTKNVEIMRSNAERLEGIFHTVDSIKSDLNKCGMRLSELIKFYEFKAFNSTMSGFTVYYGIADETLIAPAEKGDRKIELAHNEFFKLNKKIILYHPENKKYEEFTTTMYDRARLYLDKELKQDYPISSRIMLMQKIIYRYFPAKKELQRKVNSGKFVTLIKGISDFYVTFFPDANSVLYRIEINKKEQVRGYIFLFNNIVD